MAQQLYQVLPVGGQLGTLAVEYVLGGLRKLGRPALICHHKLEAYPDAYIARRAPKQQNQKAGLSVYRDDYCPARRY